MRSTCPRGFMGVLLPDMEMKKLSIKRCKLEWMALS